MRRWLTIRRGEGGTVLVLLAFVFCIQSVLSTGKVLQLAVFLDAYGQESLAFAFFLSAAIVILVSAGYSALTRLVPTRTRVPVLLLGLAGGFVVWRLAFGSTVHDFPVDRLNAPEGVEDPYGPFVLYVWVEVASSLALVQAWAYVNDAFDPRQAKRLIPLVGLGASLSFLVNGLVVQPLVSHVIDANELTWIVAGALLLAQVAFHLAQRRGIGQITAEDRPQDLQARPESPGFFSSLREGLPQIARSPILRLAVIATVATVLSQGLLDYLFMNALRERMTKNDLAAFYAAFIALLGGAQILLQLFVSGRVLLRFGAPLVVLAAPLLVALGGVAYVIVPLFFLLVALRFGARLFKQSFYSPSLQTLYTSVPSDEKHQAMTLIKGVVSPAAYGVMGLVMLAGAAHLSTRSLAAVLAGVALFLVLVLALRTRPAYAQALRRTMRRRGKRFAAVAEEVGETLDWDTLAEVQRAVFEEPQENRALCALFLVASSTAPQVRALVNRACRRHPSARVRLEASRIIASRAWPADAARIVGLLRSEPDDRVVAQHLQTLAILRTPEGATAVLSHLEDSRQAVRASAAVALVRLGYASERAEEHLAALQQGGAAERLAVALALRASADPTLHEHCHPLLFDEDLEVQSAALRAAAALAAPELLAPVLHCYLEPGPRLEARAALESLGAVAVPAVAERLRDETLALPVRRDLQQVLAALGGQEARDVLVRFLAHRNHVLRYGAGRALASLARWSPELPRPSRVLVHARILNDLRVGYLLRHLVQGLEAQPSRLTPPLLLGELQLRLRACEDHLFTLLSLADPHATSALVLHNLRVGTRKQRTHAYELLELSFSRYITTAVIPFMEGEDRPQHVLSVLPDGWDRLRRALRDPVASLVHSRDSWLKRCAAYEYPDEVRRIAPELLEEAEAHGAILDRVARLRGLALFADTAAAELFSLCQEAPVISLQDGEVLYRSGEVGDALYVVLEGAVHLCAGGEPVGRRAAGETLGEASLEADQPRVVEARADGGAQLLRLEAPDLSWRLAVSPGLTKGMFRCFTELLARDPEDGAAIA